MHGGRTTYPKGIPQATIWYGTVIDQVFPCFQRLGIGGQQGQDGCGDAPGILVEGVHEPAHGDHKFTTVKNEGTRLRRAWKWEAVGRSLLGSDCGQVMT